MDLIKYYNESHVNIIRQGILHETILNLKYLGLNEEQIKVLCEYPDNFILYASKILCKGKDFETLIKIFDNCSKSYNGENLLNEIINMI